VSGVGDETGGGGELFEVLVDGVGWVRRGGVGVEVVAGLVGVVQPVLAGGGESVDEVVDLVVQVLAGGFGPGCGEELVEAAVDVGGGVQEPVFGGGEQCGEVVDLVGVQEDAVVLRHERRRWVGCSTAGLLAAVLYG
jgi:hypothetical protein